LTKSKNHVWFTTSGFDHGTIRVIEESMKYHTDDHMHLFGRTYFLYWYV